MKLPPYYEREKRIRTFLRNYVLPSERKEKMSEPTTKQKPVKQYRRGSIGVSIWKKSVTTDKGESVFYSANASRAYTKDDGATWEYSDNFDVDQLPVVSSLLTLAFLWIVNEQNK